MQANHPQRANKKRLLIDAIAKRVVTIFGLLVLALFLLLIAHMMSNAYPLLKTPTLVFKDSLALSQQGQKRLGQIADSTVVLSATGFGDSATTSSICSIAVESIFDKARLQSASFVHPCASRYIPVYGMQSYQSYYAMLKDDGMLELFALEKQAQRVQRRLLGSLDLLDIKEADMAQASQWRIDLDGKKLALSYRLENGERFVLWHRLDSLALPTLTKYGKSDKMWVLPRLDRVLLQVQAQLSVYNRDGKQVQVFEQALADSETKVVLSPGQLSLYMPVSSAAELKSSEQSPEMAVWRAANVNGEFVYQPAGKVDGLNSESFQSLIFDPQSLVAVALSDKQALLSFNRASSEILNRQRLAQDTLTTVDTGSSNGLSSQRNELSLHWHNQMLYVLGLDAIHRYQMQNIAGVITWKSLFEEIQYEAYDEAKYIWQTSQSAQFAEPKYSLIPLIIGSLKASVLALLVAIPLALGAAIYTAYFASSGLRNWIKPSIEMLEAVPSVIIGFIAAIWLAPFAERALFSLLLMLASLPFVVLLLAAFSAKIKRTEFYQVFKRFYVPAMAVLFILLLVSVYQLASLFQLWLAQASSVNDLGPGFIAYLSNLTISKTTVVVALALGIAVAPTIYSLVDDALFEVPEGVKQASFALGATQLQTLTKVVLVVALPSIISAIMLGLGRAFGETMIVLMVTGNTPIADWDLLSGLRSLTSNLTIELQESQVASAHYHILFFTALILFGFTFAINTVAALLKRRLRNEDLDA